MAEITANKNNPFGFLFTIVLIAGVLFGSFIYMTSKNNSSEKSSYSLTTYELNADQARIIEIVSGHAWANHGEEVNAAIKCLSDKGTWKSFRTNGFTEKDGKIVPTNLWICKVGDTFYAIITTAFEKNGINQIARLVTAYKIASDVFPTIDDFINYIVQKWDAQEINYIIQAGQDFYLSAK